MNLPQLLKFDYSGFNFEYNNLLPMNYKLTDEDQNNIDYLINNYGKSNTVILYNNQIVYDKLSVFLIQPDYNSNDKLKNFLTKVNSKLCCELTKDASIIISANKDIYHFSSYIINGINSQLTEQFVMFNNAQVYSYAGLFGTDFKFNTFQNLTAGNNCFEYSVELCDNANINLISSNSCNVINSLTVNLKDMYDNCNIKVLSLAKDKSIQGNLIKINHLNKNTSGEVNCFGVVRENATLQTDCINVIEKGNSKSAAKQNIKIINLSESAAASANPQLQINENDVVASHSAGIGKINENQLYYMQSRGITRENATNLIVEGTIKNFLNDVGEEFIYDKFM